MYYPQVVFSSIFLAASFLSAGCKARVAHTSESGVKSEDGVAPAAASTFCPGRKGGAVILFNQGPAENGVPSSKFVVWAENSAQIDDAKRQWKKLDGHRMVGFGIIEKADCDTDFMFHSASASFRRGDLSNETAQAVPDFLNSKERMESWIASLGNGFECTVCEVVDVADRRVSPPSYILKHHVQPVKKCGTLMNPDLIQFGADDAGPFGMFPLKLANAETRQKLTELVASTVCIDAVWKFSDAPIPVTAGVITKGVEISEATHIVVTKTKIDEQEPFLACRDKIATIPKVDVIISDHNEPKVVVKTTSAAAGKIAALSCVASVTNMDGQTVGAEGR